MKHELKKSNDGYFYLEIDGRKIIVDMDKLIGKEIEFDFFAEATQSPTAVIKV